MKNIVVVWTNNYCYFREYCESLMVYLDLDIFKYTNVNEIKIEEKNKYLFLQNTPANIFHNNIYDNIILVNTEQLNLPTWYYQVMSHVNKNIPVIDYSIGNMDFVKNSLYMHVPYQYNKKEGLVELIQQTPKLHDVAICVDNIARRSVIIQELIKNGLKVVNCVGWDKGRDKLIASSKILINIHYSDSHKIFEHIRCDRWILAGQLIVSEISSCEELLDIKDLVIFEKYDLMVAKVLDVIKNYDTYYANYASKLANSFDAIVSNRKNLCLKFRQLLDKSNNL